MSKAKKAAAEQTAEQAAATLKDKTVCVRLRLSSLGTARKVASDEVAPEGVDATLIHVHKDVLKHPTISKIRTMQTRQRMTLMRWDVTPEWLQGGYYLIPTGVLGKAYEELADLQAKIEAEAKRFAEEEYEAAVAESKSRLGKLAKDADYPAASTIAGAFEARWRTVDMSPVAKVQGIAAAAWEEEKAKAEKDWQAAVAEARAILRGYAVQLVARLTDLLRPSEDGTPRAFRGEPALEKLRGFLEDFKLRDVTEDAELAGVVERAKGLLDGVDVNDLKGADEISQEARNFVAEQLKTVGDELAGMVEGAPVRKFML